MSINRVGAHELEKRGLTQPYFKIEQDEKIPLEVMKSKAYQKFPSVWKKVGGYFSFFVCLLHNRSES